MLLLHGVHRPDAFQQLPDLRRFSGVGEAVALMPVCERSQALFQRAQRQLVSVFSDVSHHGLSCGGQEPAPGDFEMGEGGSVALRRVLTNARLQVSVCLAGHFNHHIYPSQPAMARPGHLYRHSGHLTPAARPSKL